MDPIRLQLKLDLDTPETLDPAVFIPIFHRWIRDSVLNELLIDVADYQHVPEGPAVALIGHALDWVIDLGDGHMGLLVFRKRGLNSDFSGKIADTLAQLSRACVQLEEAPELAKHGLRLRRDALLLRVPDALNAPDNDAAFATTTALLQQVLQAKQPQMQLQCERISKRAEPLQCRVQCSEALDVSMWAQHRHS